MPKILTIVITYNGMCWVDRCLGSMATSTVHSDVFVIDNGSTDQTADYIAEHYPTAFLFRSPKNLMFGRGNNVGLEYALKNGYDYVYLLNQDAWVMPDTLGKLVETHCAHPEYGILSPMQLKPCGTDFENLFNVLVVKRNQVFADDLASRELKDVYEVRFVQAAHWLISRECLEKVGGFSPSFPHYGEDNNMCNRALYNSFKIGVVPAAKAVHDADTKPPMTKKQRSYRQYIDFVILLSEIYEAKPAFENFVYMLKKSKGLCVMYKSLYPFGILMKTLTKWPGIERNRRVSIRQKRAFLNNDV